MQNEIHIFMFAKMKNLKALLCVLLLLGAAIPALACSRVVYKGDKGIVLVGRTLDWRTPIPTNLYVYPAGMQKESMNSGQRLTWTSQYGSVVAVGYDGGVTEGMNQAGLVVNGLFCKGSVYRTEGPDGTEPVMSLAMISAYFLDNFATVDEVYAWLQENTFAINGQTFDGGTVSLLHWGITDAQGQTLVMEYENGELNLHLGSELTVLTNDPQLPQMQAINAYWQKIGGTHALPGTVSSPDRFARASFFLGSVPKDFEYPQAFGSLSSIMGTVSVPFGYEIEGEPNLSSTQWTSISDATGGKYYFRFADQTGYMWIDLGRLVLTPGAPVLKLDTTDHTGLSGCVNDKLRPSAPFTPMY